MSPYSRVLLVKHEGTAGREVQSLKKLCATSVGSKMNSKYELYQNENENIC